MSSAPAPARPINAPGGTPEGDGEGGGPARSMKIPRRLSTGALSLLLLAACTPEWAWVSSLGVHMSYDPPLDGWMSKENADEQAMHLLGGLADRGWPLARTAACLTPIIVISQPVPFHCGEGFCNGIERETMLHVVATECPWASTFRHEAAHWLQSCVLNIYDPGHFDLLTWPAADAYVPCGP